MYKPKDKWKKSTYKHWDSQAKEYMQTLRRTSKRVHTNTETQKQKSTYEH